MEGRMMKNSHFGIRSILAVSFLGINLFTLTAMSEESYQIAWSRQLGTSADDVSNSVATDAFGYIYTSGNTSGSLGGTNAGGTDAYLAKYNPDGSLLWTKQLGTSSLDKSNSVAMDTHGDAYISGYTHGNLAGNYGSFCDAFLAKYDSAGNCRRIKQLSTNNLDSYYSSYSVAVDTFGNAFISGYKKIRSLGNPNKSYAFLAKYNSAGNLLWNELIGTSSGSYSYSVATDTSGNAYISGDTYGSLGGINAGGKDTYLAKYDTEGNLLWTQQLGTSGKDYSRSVAVDAFGNAYISGSTEGNLGGVNAGDFDAFLAKYDPEGNLLWTQQLGTGREDYSRSIAVDVFGNAYISGSTEGSLGGINAGSFDVFLAKYDMTGNLLWTEQYGTSASDESNSVTVDALGNVLISGYTNGSLYGINAGNSDAFLIKFAVPEPGTLCLLAIGGIALVRRRKR
jgi:Beta-propeller repeat/PEP-CTERM motif